MPTADNIIQVRDVTLKDVPAITAVHRGSEGPWIDPASCAMIVNHRLLRPFYGHVAEYKGEVVGHAEWIIGKDPDFCNPYLYLGMLQVRDDVRGGGVGRRLIDVGKSLARQTGCDRLRTLCEEEVEDFYARCGFKTTGRTVTCRSRVKTTIAPSSWKRGRAVPARVPEKYPMQFGWFQACAVHMWEQCNHPVRAADDFYMHPCLVRNDGQAYLQLRFRDPSEAIVISWAAPDTSYNELLDIAHHLATLHSIFHITLALPGEKTCRLPDNLACEDDSLIMEKTL